ncbi:MAG: recombinase family protein [Acidobacteria bacterium]|nr:recombinase family protein [Acidobacteriota bacterium]
MGRRGTLRDAGVDQANLCHDPASGVRDDRPGLHSLVARPAPGRGVRCLEARPPRPQPRPSGNTVQDLSALGVGLRMLAGQGAQIDTATAADRLVFGIFAALAEFEWEADPRTRNVRAESRKGTRPQGRQEVRAVESSGAALRWAAPMELQSAE